jgi:E3 ubiquitin-protein ligase TRIP12
MESRQICDLIEVMSGLDIKDRQLFVQFLTGSKSLPTNGFSGLKPPLTVVKAVRSTDEGPADIFLPSVMTCANFIKLPEYSSKSILKNQLMKAIQEGQGSFLLS